MEYRCVLLEQIKQGTQKWLELDRKTKGLENLNKFMLINMVSSPTTPN